METQNKHVQKNNSGVITITDTKIYYRVPVTKAIVCHINRNIDQQNKVKDTNISRYNNNYLIFDKNSQKHNLEKRMYV